MAVIVVTNLNDAGAGSLRDAITTANFNGDPQDDIYFHPSLLNGTIQLQSPLLIALGVVNIHANDGDNTTPNITIDAGTRCQILTIGNGALSVIDGIKFTGGLDQRPADGSDAGGAIRNYGALTVVNSVFEFNQAAGGNAAGPGQNGGNAGGAILNAGFLVVDDCQFFTNVGYGGDGGDGADGDFATYGTYRGQDGGRGGSAASGIYNAPGAELQFPGVAGNLTAFQSGSALAGWGGDGGAGASAPSFGSEYDATGGNGGRGGAAAVGILDFGHTVGGPVPAVLNGIPGQVLSPGNGGAGGAGGSNDGQPAADGAAGAAGPQHPHYVGFGSEGADDFSGGFNMPGLWYGNGGGDVFDSRFYPDVTVYGGGGDDTLDADDNDRMYGEAGNDIINVFGTEAGGILDGGEGVDLVALYAFDFDEGATVDLRPAFFTDRHGARYYSFEKVVGTDQAQRIIGNGENNTIQGLDGNDTLVGGGGNDVLAGDGDNDGLTGDAGNDTLIGGLGADTLDGGLGGDRMQGGDGDDAYTVDSRGDAVVEDTAGIGGGVDVVSSSVLFTLGANLENLVLTGVRNVAGTGNELGNRITGNIGDNILQGLDGADTLTGGDGADELRGGAGIDRMNGGLGNDDRFFVDDDGDQTIETNANPASGGNDTVFSSVSRALGANLENLRLQGSGDLSGTGNSLANKIDGNSGANLLRGLAGADTIRGKEGADTLDGGEGNDTLSGGGGGDVFRVASSNAGVDRILDFSRNFDRFELSGGSFSAVSIAPNGDAVLTHAGGAIRVANPPNLTLAQWNALVVTPNGKLAGPVTADLSVPHDDGGAAGDGPVAFDSARFPGHASGHLSHGDWLHA